MFMRSATSSLAASPSSPPHRRRDPGVLVVDSDPLATTTASAAQPPSMRFLMAPESFAQSSEGSVYSARTIINNNNSITGNNNVSYAGANIHGNIVNVGKVSLGDRIKNFFGNTNNGEVNYNAVAVVSSAKKERGPTTTTTTTTRTRTQPHYIGGRALLGHSNGFDESTMALALTNGDDGTCNSQLSTTSARGGGRDTPGNHGFNDCDSNEEIGGDPLFGWNILAIFVLLGALIGKLFFFG